ncbi:MAG TPA: hypothetical protein VN493_05360 [Thermoanaerobaculia bacterium]|nr:hypothetical protein [Thermoanaerobaculia bacterium]
MARLSLRAAVLTAASLLGGPLQALPAPGYVLEKVRAVGGNEIWGVQDGIVYQSPGCGTPGTRTSPLSGTLEDPLGLELTIAGCPPMAPPPVVKCQVYLQDHETQTFQFRGWSHSFPLQLPEETGVFDLALHCSVSGQPLFPVETTLYMTYQRPQDHVSPPLENWYRGACSWGAGLTAGATEDQVVATILENLYAYGQRHWRYGYCRIRGNLCQFGETSVHAGTCGLQCFPLYSLCRCDWFRLVEPGSPCNFADCFVFSDVLQYMSAVMGVGGLVPQQVRGDKQQGFTTRRPLQSIDPAFTGNVECQPGGKPCEYLFLNHALLLRGCRPDDLGSGAQGCQIFDATFGKVYRNLSELIAANADEWGLNILFPEKLACFRRSGYGMFRFYQEVPRPLADESRPPLCQVFQGLPSVVFTKKAPEVVGEDGGVLKIAVQVEVLRAGAFSIWGALYQDGMLISDRPGFRLVSPIARTYFAGKPGQYEPVLGFSMEDLRSVSGNQLILQAALEDAGGITQEEESVVQVNPENLRKGERPVRLLPEPLRVEIVRDRTEKAFLRVSSSIAVQQAGEYLVEARLWKEGSTAAYAGSRVHLEQADTEIEVDFPADIAAGEYRVTLTLHAPGPLYPIHSETFPLVVKAPDAAAPRTTPPASAEPRPPSRPPPPRPRPRACSSRAGTPSRPGDRTATGPAVS